MEIFERVATPIVAPLGSLVIVLVVAVFILMQMEDLRGPDDSAVRLRGPAQDDGGAGRGGGAAEAGISSPSWR